MHQHTIPLTKLFKELNSSKDGLTTKEAKDRLEKHGLNELKTKKKVHPIVKFLKQFTNFFALLLIVGSALAFFAESLQPNQGNLYIGIALLGVVILNAVFTFIQQYQSEKIMESFKKMLPTQVKVQRNGKKVLIDAKELVPGDVIFLEEGDKVPADGRLLEINSLKIDLSSITGESEPELRKLEATHKNILESRNMVFSGTLVTTGNGKALVYGTGMDTEIGKIVKLTKETKQAETPLHKELNHFIKIISSIAIFLGVTFFIISLFLGMPHIGALIFAIGIIVANVPEGLLPTVTLALSMAARRMAKKNALIKNLESVETLGSTTVICTDKTGTLTQNNMQVNSLYLNMEEYDIKEKNDDFQTALQIMTLCNNAHESKGVLHGDPTETSLLKFAEKFGKLTEAKRVHESPFDSHTKRMITTNFINKKKIAHLKGAPEVVLEKCSKIDIRGKVKKLTPSQKKEIIEQYEELASRGERILALAYKATKTEKAVEKEFIFVGLVGMVDPPRPEVTEAIEKCQTAGIKVIMITGDHALTAESIAKKVSLIDGEATIIHGDDLNKMSDDKLKEILQKDNLIFARSSPKDKLRIVKTLQSLKHVVTVTGDGVNDAPALKNADMGVSMGVIGTEVAREASDMVLMDDNFATIVSAVEEGRTIFENIKKFVAYILTSNIPEILPFIVFALFSNSIPFLALTVVLILAIDLGTDLIPALGLGTEKPEIDVMKKQPRKRTERLLTPNLLFMSYGIVGMIQAAAGFTAFFYVLFTNGWTWGQELAFNDPIYLTAVSAFFASIIFAQIADVYICRTRRQSVFSVGFFSNKLVLIGILSELLLLALIIYFPLTQPIFGTHPLTIDQILISWPFMFLIFFGDELRKFLIRRGNTFIEKYLNW